MWTIAALAGGLCHQGDTTGQWAGDACVALCIKGSPEEPVHVPYPYPGRVDSPQQSLAACGCF